MVSVGMITVVCGMSVGMNMVYVLCLWYEHSDAHERCGAIHLAGAEVSEGY